MFFLRSQNFWVLTPHSQARYAEHRLEDRLCQEEIKFRQWRDDNIRRRNNYIPFAFNMLRILAEEGKLRHLIEKAQVPKQVRQQEQYQ